MIGLVVFSPVFVILTLLIRRKLGKPVLFRQMRPGLKGVPFEMLKFRSMLDAADPDGVPLPDKERLTSFGKKLRASSLDEIPGLWNVVKGEMSIVGPRPLLMEYLPLYTAKQSRRMDVRPGITGWAQINGRNGLTWEEKFALDLWYVDNQSLWLDLKIVLRTVRKVIKSDAISADGEVTMPKFTGTRNQ